ncbi:Pectin degradation repressor protein KdgR [Tepidanaerobacter acetatoxydans Re1]|uniref:Glycerol operon regulatory protein n=1 Tax=Tepidanaerobacter acetatoxydans (strain DSM 21804 / JCM 16047 / Re1) TaxID=1209989 RepID=F4LU29_TEPAE|nr:IclR family transcriptional regulator [Tepidanaerobacter acetatoxydans]AEE90555.1 transcriptional regulator, IclR family [Tepidanaerobacter acetatoxydans Re1]CCP25071.1 Pectin degradation repressor protein KdgR [Tepidanaerobacter acetatoxydans Re1]
MAQDNTVQSVERAIKILEELAAEKEGLGVTELSQRVNLHKSTVHRMLTTLLNLGYVEQNALSEKYRLGMKILFLGGSILERMDIRHEAHDLLEELSGKVNEAVHLVIPDGFKAVYIDKLDSNKTIRMCSQIGRIAPLHASAVGKAILAFSSPRFVNEVIEQGLARYTANTITEPRELMRHLEIIKERGFAIDDEENEKGIRCIAAPIFDYTGKVIGAISVSGPTVTVTKKQVEKISEDVMECARKISQRMGWKVD